MSDLIDTNPIVADGTYDLQVIPGKPYLLTIKGDFGGGTVALSVRSNIDTDVFDDVIGGSGWETDTEDTFIPSGSVARFTATDSTDPSIRISLIPIRYTP